MMAEEEIMQEFGSEMDLQMDPIQNLRINQ